MDVEVDEDDVVLDDEVVEGLLMLEDVLEVETGLVVKVVVVETEEVEDDDDEVEDDNVL